MRKSWRLAAVVCVALAGGAARAQEDSGWGLGVAGAAHFPISTGVQVELDFPFRLRLIGGYGVVPKTFQNAVNQALVALDAYQGDVGDLVLESIESTSVRRIGLGMRPFRYAGFYVEAMYSNVTLQGSIPLAELVAPLYRGAVLPVDDQGKPGLRLRATLHMVHPQLGWEWSIWRFYLRATVGAALTVAAQSDLTAVEEDGTEHDAGPFDDVVEGYVNAGLRHRAHVPTGSFVVGFHFF